MTIKEHISSDIKYINFKRRPSGATPLSPVYIPDFPGLEGYVRISEENTKKAEPKLSPHSFDLIFPNGKVLFYRGVEHPRVADHPQIDDLKKIILIAQPDIILHERAPITLDSNMTMAQAIEVYGEVGFLYHFIGNLKHSEHYLYEPKLFSFDQPVSEGIQGMQEKHYTNEQIAVYRTGLMMYGWYRPYRQKGEHIPEELAEEAFLQYAAREDSPSDNLHQTLSLLPRDDAQLWTLDLLKATYHDMTGKEFRFTTLAPHLDFREMFDDDSKVRDTDMMKQVQLALYSRNRVMVVAGDYHAYQQKEILPYLL